MQCIAKRNMQTLCYTVCATYLNDKTNLIHLLFELYANHYSHSLNVRFLEAFQSRLKLLGDHDFDQGRLLVELFLLLYNSEMKRGDSHKVKKTIYEASDIQILIVDDSNLGLCKDICSSYLKNGQQHDVSYPHVPETYRRDWIWIVWIQLMKIAHKLDKNLYRICKIQLDIFTVKYNRKAAKQRINILHNIVIHVSNFYTNKHAFVLENKQIFKLSFIEIMLKIDMIFQQFGHSKKKNTNAYLYECAMHLIPGNESKRHVVQYHHIPEVKSVEFKEEKIKIDDIKRVETC
jgi:hypothetical protein